MPADRTGEDKVLLIACGALAKEILDIKERNDWRHLELVCLPAQLHLYPDRIPDAVEKAVIANRDRYSRIFVVYADCGTGGLLQARCEQLGVEMVRGPHCYAFYDGLDRFERNSENEITCFYLTDFLVRQFESFIIKPLGLDRYPSLKSTYFGNYTALIYLAQIDDPRLDQLAQSHAEYLGLDYQRRLTGYGDLETAMAHA